MYVLVFFSVIAAGVFVLSRKKEKPIEYLTSSWGYNYGDIEEISLASDLIALIKVNDIESTTVNNGIPFTIFSVDVIEPIYNTNAGESISIYMTGGETADKIVEIEDDPLLQKKEECLVFCKKNPDGTYQILSGPQGRLLYQDGKLSSLNMVNDRVAKANPYSNIEIFQADAKEMIDEIKTYVE